MKGQPNRWYVPAQLRELHRALERQATALIKAADRPRRKAAPNMTRKPAALPALPRQLRLSDLPDPWPEMFDTHLQRVDPSIRKLTYDFSWEQMNTVCDIADSIWFGYDRNYYWLDVPTIEFAISLAITTVYELANPGLAIFRSTVH